jgi:hypothetical protein
VRPTTHRFRLGAVPRQAAAGMRSVACIQSIA